MFPDVQRVIAYPFKGFLITFVIVPGCAVSSCTVYNVAVDGGSKSKIKEVRRLLSQRSLRVQVLQYIQPEGCAPVKVLSFAAVQHRFKFLNRVITSAQPAV